MDTSSHPPSSPSCPMIRRDKRRVMNRTERRQKGSRFSDLIWSDLIQSGGWAKRRVEFLYHELHRLYFFHFDIFFFYLWFWKEVRVGDRDRFTLRCKDSRVLFCRLLFIVSALRARGTTQMPVFRSHPQTVMTGSIQSARSPFLPSLRGVARRLLSCPPILRDVSRGGMDQTKPCLLLHMGRNQTSICRPAKVKSVTVSVQKFIVAPCQDETRGFSGLHGTRLWSFQARLTFISHPVSFVYIIIIVIF